MSDRVVRLDALLQEEISAVIARDLHDPRVGFVTITHVDVSADLRHATVWVSLIGQPDERRATLRALTHAMPFVRHRLGALRLKRIPELHVRADHAVERGTRVLHILDEIEAGREPANPPTGETLPTPATPRTATTEKGPA
ncbi:MAG: 30S ribosome-binding factor RbfA [Candidatus Limnocylindrales bacterium]